MIRPKRCTLVLSRPRFHPKDTSRQSFRQPASRPFVGSFLGSALGPCPLRRLSRTKTLPYTSQAVFNAVSDVSGYPKFLPFTISSQVTSTDQHGHPTRAKLTVGYSNFGLEEQWDSVIHCDHEKGIVEAKSSGQNSQGLFETLEARWKIANMQDSGHKTVVKLVVDVKFRNPIYDQMFSQVEDKVADRMISAFEERVQQLDARQP